jgi:hypothetical protein
MLSAALGNPNVEQELNLTSRANNAFRAPIESQHKSRSAGFGAQPMNNSNSTADVHQSLQPLPLTLGEIPFGAECKQRLRFIVICAENMVNNV